MSNMPIPRSLRRFCQCGVWGPPSVHSRCKDASCDCTAWIFGPFDFGFCLAKHCNSVAVAFVASLLRWFDPTAVIRAIWTVVVLPVYRQTISVAVSVRPFRKMAVPVEQQLHASPTIVRVSRESLVPTSRSQIVPNAIQARASFPRHIFIVLPTVTYNVEGSILQLS